MSEQATPMIDPLDLANSNNLMRLWQSMGAEPWPDKHWRQSASWPHKIFPVESERYELDHWHPEQGADKRPAFVPVFMHWENSEAFRDQLESAGAALAFRQIGMVHVLQADRGECPEYPTNLVFKRISHADDCEQWTKTCASAFNYEMDPAVIQHLAEHPDITLLLGRLDDQPVATALLYQTGPVVGVHQVGVIPSWQGHGFGIETMQAVMRTASVLPNAAYVTLQAAEAAQTLYQKFGFASRFLINNYYLE